MSKKNNKSGKKRNGGKRYGGRTGVSNVLAPGVGRTTAKPFASPDITYDGKLGLSALCPMHLPLPRPIAPYTVVRLTTSFSSANEYMLFGTFRMDEPAATYAETRWLNTGVMEWASASGGLPMQSTIPVMRGFPGLGDDYFVPAAMTIQVLNTNALQSTNGLIVAGNMKTSLAPGAKTANISTVFNELINVSAPRLMSAPKLALRGVQADLQPSNMSALADFRLPGSSGSSPQVMNAQSDGFLPMFLRNEQQVTLNFVVTIELRMRFSTSNIASASHRQYPHAPLSVWDRAVQGATMIGHGIVDISEKVSAVGSAVQAGLDMAGPLSKIVMAAPKAL